ncbi:hypothetical protein MIMGU_mgv1a0235692mg, partial [Erythranthe guttata]
WEKPEELMLYEQQQQNPSKQHNQVQSHQTEPSTQQAPQMQVQLQGPHRAQLHNQAKPLQQPSQSSELGYAQIPPVNDPSRYQQVRVEKFNIHSPLLLSSFFSFPYVIYLVTFYLHSISQGAQGGSQEWMWTNKN